MRIGAAFGRLPQVEEERKLGGRYRLEKELGRGGMAVVWRAVDEVLNRPVAVKLLAGRYVGDPRFRARILHEARAAATLSHPNIAQVYDFGESSEHGRTVPYVVMELINGPTLQQRVARGRIPPRTVFRICGEIASALAAAHDDGLVHRDIKLANVMVTPAGAKVVDFGIAAVAGPASPEDALLGTPAYLAPERLTGGTIEPASDVYALGVLLYRLLAGTSPWTVETTTQMLTAHVHIEPAPLPRLPGVPSEVVDLVARCLAKEPTDRPGADEVAGLLGDAAEAASAFRAPGVRGDDRGSRAATVPDPEAEQPVADPTAPLFPPPVDGVAVTGEGADDVALVRESMASVRGRSEGGAATGRARGAPATAPGGGAATTGRAGSGWRALRVPLRSKRAKLLAGALTAALIAALPLLMAGGGGRSGAEPGIAAPPVVSPWVRETEAVAPVGSRPTEAATRPGRTPSAAAGASGFPSFAAVPIPEPAESSGALPPEPSAGVSSVAPEPSVTVSVTPTSPAPEGTVLSSPGGSVLARCADGGAELLAWEPASGFTVQRVDPGPSLAPSVVFAGRLSRYRMSVTCVSGRPSAVVLPI